MATDQPMSDLAQRAAAGDRRAFEALVRRFGPRLEAIVRSRMGVRVRARIDVEDVVQETFLKALEAEGRFEWQGEEAFFAWLGSIAEHVLWNELRRGSRTLLDLEDEIVATTASPSRGLRREERRERLERSLGRLSPDHRQVIVLARLERLKIETIAQRMERSPNAVKKLLARALAELKKGFGDTDSFHLPDRPLGAAGGAREE